MDEFRYESQFVSQFPSDVHDSPGQGPLYYFAPSFNFALKTRSLRFGF